MDGRLQFYHVLRGDENEKLNFYAIYFRVYGMHKENLSQKSMLYFFSIIFILASVFGSFHTLQAANTGLIITEIMYNLEGADDPHEWMYATKQLFLYS